MPTKLISIDLSDVRKKLGILAEGLDRGLLVAVAEWLRFTIREAFQDQASPEGVPWKTLTADYAATKKKGLRILEKSGDLLQNVDRSIVIDGNNVRATSSLIYSAIHQFGGTINLPAIFPRKAKALHFSAGNKKFFAKRVKSHKVKIPARPYIPSPEFAEKQAANVVEETIDDLVRKAGAGPE